MGMGGISIWQLLIILVIVLVLFGTKRLKNLGSDLGSAVKGFRSAMSDTEREADEDKKPAGQLAAEADEPRTQKSAPAENRAPDTANRSDSRG